jgi:ligand-binding SRPBCC domain-containing protein
MPVIHIETFIAAPMGQCFDLMRNVDIHCKSASRTRERAVAGMTSGLLNEGDEVTWEAVHCGVKQQLTVRITRCDRPRLLVDEMVRGAFKAFTHTHEFLSVDGGTLMIDDFRYSSPFGVLGKIADRVFLVRYMRVFLEERARFLKSTAEGKRVAAEIEAEATGLDNS